LSETAVFVTHGPVASGSRRDRGRDDDAGATGSRHQEDAASLRRHMCGLPGRSGCWPAGRLASDEQDGDLSRLPRAVDAHARGEHARRLPRAGVSAATPAARGSRASKVPVSRRCPAGGHARSCHDQGVQGRCGGRAGGSCTAREALRREALFLHNRRRGAGARSGDIDHIAVTASGVYVLDAKNYANARVRVRRIGGIFSARKEQLLLNGRDRTKLLDSLDKQFLAVSAALEGRSIPVTAMLCFVGADLPFIRVAAGQGCSGCRAPRCEQAASEAGALGCGRSSGDLGPSGGRTAAGVNASTTSRRVPTGQPASASPLKTSLPCQATHSGAGREVPRRGSSGLPCRS
jgi:hypothetical protein